MQEQFLGQMHTMQEQNAILQAQHAAVQEQNALLRAQLELAQSRHVPSPMCASTSVIDSDTSTPKFPLPLVINLHTSLFL